MELPLKDGSQYAVEDSLYSDLCQCYPSLDVSEHLQEMRIWLVCNDQKRKTRRGIKRFINSWLSRAKGNNSAGYQSNSSKGKDKHATARDNRAASRAAILGTPVEPPCSSNGFVGSARENLWLDMEEKVGR